MDLQYLGLIHPEWDSEIGDEEFARLSQPDPLQGTFHRLSPTLYGHLPQNVKVQLTLQQKRIDILGNNLVKRMEEVLTSPAVEGGSFYNEAVGRDLAALCRAIERSYAKFHTPLPRALRHSVIRVLFDFATRHANPDLVYHPKAIRAAVSLLIDLLWAESSTLSEARTYKSFEEQKLVPPVSFEVDSPRLVLEWRPLYDLARVMLNMENDRRRATHYASSLVLDASTLDRLLSAARFFLAPEATEEILETIFPLISLKPGSTLESVAVSSSKPNAEIVDYMMRLSKDEDLLFLSNFLPQPLGPSNIDFHLIVDQLINLWRIVPSSLIWDRIIVTLLNDISHFNVIRWKPNQVRIILSVPLRELDLATAGTPLARPGNSNETSFIATSRPLGRVLGSLIGTMLATDDLYEKSLADSSINKSETTTGIFLQWMEQIEAYLHPNSSVAGARTLKNVLLGLLSDLLERYRAAMSVNDYKKFASKVKEFSSESQGLYDTMDLPVIEHGSLKDFIIKESTWDALIPVFDRIRVHLMDSRLGRDMSFLVAHLRPEYLHRSIFPRIFYALENPILSGQLHVPVSMQIVTDLVPLLVSIPGAPTRLTELLGLLLPQVDPNSPDRSEQAFNLVLAILLAVTERKRSQSENATHYSKEIEAITLPADLASTLIGKSFNEIKARLLHKVKPEVYSPPFGDNSASEDQESESSAPGLESELYTLEESLADWIVEFFERVIHFIEGAPSGSSSSSSLVQCIKAVLDFAYLCSESLFNILLRRLTDAVTATPKAKTELNPLVDAFSRARPNLVLQACFESWLNDVKKRSQNTKAGKQQSESEADVMAWKLDLLRLILKRSGVPIGTHEKTLLSIIEPLLQDEDKGIRRAALHVLSAGLGPMKPVYNVHADPASSGKFNNFVDVLLNHAIFVEPTRYSLEQAARWSLQFIRPAIAAVNEATLLYKNASESEKKGDEVAAEEKSDVEKPNASTSESTSTTLDSNAKPSEKLATNTVTPIPPPKGLGEQLRLLFEFLTALGPVLPTKQPETKNIDRKSVV